MTTKLEHIPGPWGVQEHVLPDGEIQTRITFEDGRPLGTADRWANWQANARVLALAPTAPHHCSDPECPGDVNRQKLEAFDELKASHKRLLDALGNASSSAKHLIVEWGSCLLGYGEGAELSARLKLDIDTAIAQAPEGPCSSDSLSAGRP